MKTSKQLIFHFLGILFLLASCSDDPTKQQVFEDFVKEQLPGKGKDLRVQHFILNHYNFLNEEELFNGEEYDTNHVCLFIKDGQDFLYSFRLVTTGKSEGIDNYGSDYKVYNTKGGISKDELKSFQNNFRKLAYFLYEKNSEHLKYKPHQEVLNKADLNLYKQDLKQRLFFANANLKRLGFKEAPTQLILKRISSSKDKKHIYLRIKENKNELILDVNGHSIEALIHYDDKYNFTDPELLALEAALEARGAIHKLKHIKTEFIEDCDGVKSDNCGLPHVTNLFIKYKGVYYGIDKWNEIL
jgi:hypothetical protein